MTLGISIEPNEDLSSSLDTSFLRNDDKLDRFGNCISSFKNIPGLVGFWPLSSTQRSTGNAYDLSGQNRTLTYNGNPTYNIYNDFVPYIVFDGINDGLNRADETDLDIIGTETIYNSSVRGLTIGGWFRAKQTGVGGFIIGKGNDVNSPYSILQGATDIAFFRVRNPADTLNFQAVFSGGFTIPDIWQFIVGRYNPSVELKIWVNVATAINTTSIPSSIFNGADAFSIGADGIGGNDWEGDASLCFLSANALSDAFINGLFQQSRVVFGV